MAVSSIFESQVAASGDDGRIREGGFSTTTKNPWAGYRAELSDYLACHCFMRFDNVTIPSGATINNAYLQVYADSDGTGIARLKVYGVDEDDAAAPTSEAEYNADPQTTASVDWDGAWTQDTWEQSPNISTVIQEIVDRGGWASGNAMVLQLEDDLGSGNNYNRPRNYDQNSAHAAKLYISYSEAASDIDEEAKAETADLSEFDSTAAGTAAGGSISASTAAGLAGTEYGFAIVTSGTGSESYGQWDVSAPSGGEFRVRLYLDPNSLTMANSDTFYILEAEGTSGTDIATLRLEYTTASGYNLDFDVYTDAAAASEVNAPVISDAPHYIEVSVQRAASSASSDGGGTIWVDGSTTGNLSNVDNYDQFALLGRMRLGASGSLDAGTSGTFYLDEIKATSDGNYIGPRIGRCRKRHLMQGVGLGTKIGSSKA